MELFTKSFVDGCTFNFYYRMSNLAQGHGRQKNKILEKQDFETYTVAHSLQGAFSFYVEYKHEID